MKTRSHWAAALAFIFSMGVGATSLSRTDENPDLGFPEMPSWLFAPATDTIPFRGVANDTLGRLAGLPGWGNTRWECQDSVRTGAGQAFYWPVTVLTGDTLNGPPGTFIAAIDSAITHQSHSNCHDIVLLKGGFYQPSVPFNTRADSLDFIHVAGQTARGEGATFTNYYGYESRGSIGRLFEYYRVRYPGGSGGQEDIWRCRACSKQAFRHISVAWSTTGDNQFLFEGGSNAVALPNDPGKYQTAHMLLGFEPDGAHATTFGLGGAPYSYKRRPSNITLYQNFFQGPGRRMPRLGAQVDSVSVIHTIAYNWQNWPVETNANSDTGPSHRADIMGYYAKRGPGSSAVMPIKIGQNDSTTATGHRMNVQDVQAIENNYTVNIGQDSIVRGSQRTVGCEELVPPDSVYMDGTPDYGWCTVKYDPVPLHFFVQDTMPTGPSYAQFAITPFDSAARAVILQRAGNSRQLNCNGTWTAWGSQRDSIDTRAITQFNDSTGSDTLLINTGTSRSVGAPADGTACADVDTDGLPNEYETSQCGTTTCIPSWGEWVNGRWAGDWYLQGCNLDGTLAGDRTTSCGGTALTLPPDTIPAFAGAGGTARGWGATAFGGIGGSRSKPLRVHFVTNTNNNGAGSFFNALMSTSDTTYDIIMFRTGGRLAYYWGDTTDSAKVLSHVYVAGQTAPGGGFIYGIRSPLGQELTQYGQDIVIRYLSGQKFGGRGIRMCGDRVILDHMSISRVGADPGASNTDAMQTCQRSGTPEGRFGTYTVSYNLLGDAHMDGNSTTNFNGKLQTVYGNYLFGVGRRMFNINSDTAALSGFKLANNVVYNWGGNGYYAGIFSTQVVGSYVSNYIKPGPATTGGQLWQNAPAHWQDLCGATAYPSGCDFSLQWERNRNAINSYTIIPADTSWANGELRCRNSGVNEYTPDCAADNDLVPQDFRRNTDIWTHIGQAPYWPYTVRTTMPDVYLDSIMNEAGNSKMLNCDGTWSARRSTYDSTKVAEFYSNTGPSTAIDWDYITHAHEDSVPVIPIPAAGTPCAMVTTGQGTGLYHAWLFANGFDSTAAGAPPADSVTASGYLLIEHMLNGSNPNDATPWAVSGGSGATYGVVSRYVYFVPMVTAFGVRYPDFTPYTNFGYGILNPAEDTMMVVACAASGVPADSATVHARVSAWNRPGVNTSVLVRDLTPWSGMGC